MAMGRRQDEQQGFWIATQDLPSSPGHPFYEQLNKLLDKAGFDAFCEEQSERFYAETMGRPSIRPGVYFRMLMIGYFEKLDSERQIAWRCADSLSLRSIMRKDTGQTYREYLVESAKAPGIEAPTAA